LKGADEGNEMFVESIQTNIRWLDMEATKQELARKIYMVYAKHKGKPKTREVRR